MLHPGKSVAVSGRQKSSRVAGTSFPAGLPCFARLGWTLTVLEGTAASWVQERESPQCSRSGFVQTGPATDFRFIWLAQFWSFVVGRLALGSPPAHQNTGRIDEQGRDTTAHRRRRPGGAFRATGELINP